MRIVSEKECREIVKNNILRQSNICQLPLWKVWEKARIFFHLFILLLSTLLAIETGDYYTNEIFYVLGISSLDLFWRWIVALLGILVILIISLFMIVIHEFIHVLSYKLLGCDCVVVVNGILTISVMANMWLKKWQSLCSIISPFICTFIIILIFQIVFDCLLIFLWLQLINFAISCSDILNFIIILKKVPSNAVLFEHYFRRQQ